ncbi:MAG: hypothetical protein ACI4T9_04320, partial [Prevotella sp.]
RENLPHLGLTKFNLFEVVTTTGIPTTGTTPTTNTIVPLSSAKPTVVKSREKPMQKYRVAATRRNPL